MHWWTLIVGILVGMFIMPKILSMFSGGKSSAAG